MTAILFVLSGLVAGCALLEGSRRELAKQELGVMFYSDLGPDSLDVSSYPAEQQRNYKTYSRVCSECHSLARSINSPMASREFWEMYVQAMRRRSYYGPGLPLSAEEVKAIVDFLEYDSQVRKLARKDEFEREAGELKRRFNALIDERARKL